ncbi:MAG: histidine phosphatase family protein [Planctomycetes bacterium]|nr:histidine phosphatase family protein [Planctomycetota bacterium]
MSDRRLWLVRHGETEGQSSLRFHGRNDVRLCDEGRQQIRNLAPLLQGVDFERVVHSPLARAAESASILAALCALPAGRLAADERLREISFGACEGMTEAEIEAAFPGFLARFRAGEADTFPAGEPRPEFARRVAAAMDDLLGLPWQRDVLVVAHRGTLRQAMRRVLRLPHGIDDPFGVELASVSVLRQGEGWQLDVLGLLP